MRACMTGRWSWTRSDRTQDSSRPSKKCSTMCGSPNRAHRVRKPIDYRAWVPSCKVGSECGARYSSRNHSRGRRVARIGAMLELVCKGTPTGIDASRIVRRSEKMPAMHQRMTRTIHARMLYAAGWRKTWRNRSQDNPPTFLLGCPRCLRTHYPTRRQPSLESGGKRGPGV